MTHTRADMINIKAPADMPITAIINFAASQGLKLIKDEDGLVMVKVDPKTTIERVMARMVGTHGN